MTARLCKTEHLGFSREAHGGLLPWSLSVLVFFFVNAQMWESAKAPSFHRSSAQEIACTNEADWSDRVGKRCEDYRSRCDDPLALLLDSDWRAAALPKAGAAGPGGSAGGV